MSFFSIPNLIGSLSVFTLGVVVFSRHVRSAVNASFFVLCLQLAVWTGSYAITFSTTSANVAYFYCRLACTAAMLLFWLRFSCFLFLFLLSYS